MLLTSYYEVHSESGHFNAALESIRKSLDWHSKNGVSLLKLPKVVCAFEENAAAANC